MIHKSAAYCHPIGPGRIKGDGEMNKWRRLLALVAVAWLGYATATRAGETASSVTLELGVASTVMLERPFETVLIGNPNVIDVQTQDERSVLLKPLGPGATNLVFIDKQGLVITNLAILVRDARAI
jgi:Flp pilus assembly secretin CpaC